MSISSKQTIDIQTEYDIFKLEGYLCELSANSFIPITRKNQIKERYCFNCHHEQRKFSLLYDQIFHLKSNFNPRTHRDDRQHSKFLGLNLAKEEREKPCPSRFSSEYGRRLDHIFPFNQQSHGKIEHIKKDFYRNNGIWQ